MNNEVTAIHYSKIKSISALLFLIPFCSFGAFLVFHVQDRLNIAIGIFCILFFGAFIYIYAKQLFNNHAQLTISDKGLSTPRTGFLAWQDISDERVTIEYGSKGTKLHYLEFDSLYGSVKHPIYELTLSPEKIEHLVYAGRIAHENLK